MVSLPVRQKNKIRKNKYPYPTPDSEKKFSVLSPELKLNL